MQHLQQITDEDKYDNILARQHIAHSTNFEKLVNLIVACGGEDLKTFSEIAGKMLYTQHE